MVESKRVFRTAILILALWFSAAPISALAVDCSSDNIILISQIQVDNFQTTYGPCDRVGFALFVSGGAGITNLDGLAGLIDINGLAIVGNSNLTDITGLSSLTQAGGIVIENNGLSNLNGLSGFTTLTGNLSLTGNALLTDISALSGVSSIGNLIIAQNDMLANLDSLSGLTTIANEIHINGNDVLTSVSGLSGASGFQSIEVIGNPLLANLTGLGGATSLTGLIIEDNDLLTDLDPLAGLASVGNFYTAMRIFGNAGLTNLDGLSSLVSVDADVEVVDNDVLGDCSALETVLDGTDDASAGPGPGAAGIPDVNGDVNISFNDTGCNSLSDIVGVVVSADVSVDVSPNPVTIDAGESQVFDFLIENLGPDTATNIVLEAVFGGVVTADVVPGGCSFSMGTSTLTCNSASLSSGANTHFMPEMGFPSAGAQLMTVTVAADENDPATSNNGEIVSINVNSVGPVDCTPASITLTTQSEVDDFATDHPSCDRVTGTLTIEGADIANLDGLSQLTSIDWLFIQNNPVLTSVNGLSAVTTLDGPLLIDNNDILAQLTGLSGFSSLPGGQLLIRDNPALSDISALSGLASIGASLVIENNDLLTDLDDFSSLTSVAADIIIVGNALLTDIGVLSGLSGFDSGIRLEGNPQLLNLDGLQGIGGLSSLLIVDNDSLTDVDELSSLTTVGSAQPALSISGNANLAGLGGLASLVSVDADLDIQDNPALADCSALITLLDSIDDELAGPGPGTAGIPDLNGDLTLANNLSGCNAFSEIVFGANLSLDVAPNGANLTAGDSQGFDFVLFNSGPEAATNVQVTAVFNGTVVPTVVPPECGFVTDTLTCVLPSLGIGSGDVLQPEFQFPDAGNQMLSVSVTADEDDQDPANNSETIPVIVAGVAGANLSASGAILSGPNDLGHILSGSTELTVSAAAANHGLDAATGVEVEIAMPDDWVVNTFEPGCSLTTPPGMVVLTCPLDNLPAPSLPSVPTDDLTQFTVVPHSDGEFTFTVSANETDPVPGNDVHILPVDVRDFSADLRGGFSHASSGNKLYLLNDSEFEITLRAEVIGTPEAQVSPLVVMELQPVEDVTSASFTSGGATCTDQSDASAFRTECVPNDPSFFYSQHVRSDFQVSEPGEYTATLFVDDELAYDPNTDNNSYTHTIEVLPPPPVRVRAIEVTQAVQDWNNTVLLINDKPTVVRVFLEDESELQMASQGRLLGLRGGTPVAGSPLLSINNKIYPDDDAVPDRRTLQKSINFLLPPNWTEKGELEIQFDLQANGRPAECAEPDEPLPTLPDCKVTVDFLDLGIPELDVQPIQYTTDEVKQLIFDCGGNCFGAGNPPAVNPSGYFSLSFGAPEFKTVNINIDSVMVVNENWRSTVLESAIRNRLGLDIDQVVARRMFMGEEQVGFRISIRNQTDYPTFTINTQEEGEETLTGATAFVRACTPADLDCTDGGVFVPAPTPQELMEQVIRLKNTLPLGGLDTRFAYRMDFDFKPTTYRDINPQLWMYWQLQDSLCPLCRTDALRVGGYLLGLGVEGSGGNAMNRVYSSYDGNNAGPTDFGYTYSNGPHEFSHSFGKEHSVVEQNDEATGTVGLCGAVASAEAALHPHVQQIPGVDNDGLTLDGYGPETFPTIGPLGEGADAEIWGMDTRFITGGGASPLISPTAAVDYMSYCSQDRKWPSDDSYLLVQLGLAFGAVGTPDDVNAVGNIVYVAGTIDETNNTEIAAIAGANASMPDQDEGPLRVALVDDSDVELSAVHVALQTADGAANLAEEGGLEPPIPTGFVAAVPLPEADVAALIVGDTADPLIRIEASPNAPTVTVTSPDMSTVIADNELTIEWTAFDADGDTLRSSVFYSSDGGANWSTYGINLKGESLTVPAADLAMSANALIRVSVSDGLRFAEDVSEPFEVGNSDPLVFITSLPFTEDPDYDVQLHRFEAAAWDTEDGNLAPENLMWSSDVEGFLGSGSPLDIMLPDLAQGCHTITVSIQDSQAAESEDTQEICVHEYLLKSGFE